MKFAEFEVGKTFVTEKVQLTKEDILQFAKSYDPQYFHTNEELAKESPYRSLIASGFQTLTVVWAKWIEMDILGLDCLGGIDAEIKWTKPVIPNDELFGEFTVANKKEVSDDQRGLITFDIVIKNQKEETVLTGSTNIFVKA